MPRGGKQPDALVRARAQPVSDEPLPWANQKLTRVQRVIAFLEYLPITKGILAGQKMKLLKEQKQFIKAVYGGGRKRRVKLAIMSEPRGNGKTGLVAGLALCHLLGPEAEPRGEVYSAAIDRDQAGLLFREMEAIIYEIPLFAQCTNVQRFHKRIEVERGPGEGSVYAALTSDPRRAHGLAPNLWIYDELAQVKDGGETLGNLRTGMGKRNDCLGIVISTQAPDDQHPLSELIDEGLSGDDPSIYVQLICAPESADPFDIETVKACNPAFGKFLNPTDLIEEAKQAHKMPSQEARYRNLRLNQRVRTEQGFISPEVWKDCGSEPSEDVLKDFPVYMGLDLSARNDLTALAYGAQDEQGVWHVKCDFFAPEEGLADRSLRDRTPYELWAKQGHITLTPGATVDYDFVKQRIIDLCNEYEVANIHYDRWRFDVLQREFDRDGFEPPLRPFGQGFRSFAPALDTLEAELLNERIRHGNNPVLTMCAANSVVDMDPAGNRKLNKAKSTGRIDGMVALAMALHIEDVPQPFISGELVML